MLHFTFCHGDGKTSHSANYNVTKIDTKSRSSTWRSFHFQTARILNPWHGLR